MHVFLSTYTCANMFSLWLSLIETNITFLMNNSSMSYEKFTMKTKGSLFDGYKSVIKVSLCNSSREQASILKLVWNKFSRIYFKIELNFYCHSPQRLLKTYNNTVYQTNIMIYRYTCIESKEAGRNKVFASVKLCCPVFITILGIAQPGNTRNRSFRPGYTYTALLSLHCIFLYKKIVLEKTNSFKANNLSGVSLSYKYQLLNLMYKLMYHNELNKSIFLEVLYLW